MVKVVDKQSEKKFKPDWMMFIRFSFNESIYLQLVHRDSAARTPTKTDGKAGTGMSILRKKEPTTPEG